MQLWSMDTPEFKARLAEMQAKITNALTSGAARRPAHATRVCATLRSRRNLRRALSSHWVP